MPFLKKLIQSFTDNPNPSPAYKKLNTRIESLMHDLDIISDNSKITVPISSKWRKFEGSTSKSEFTYQVEGSAEYCLVLPTEDLDVLLVDMKKGFRMTKHKHGDRIEKIVVLSGLIYYEMQNRWIGAGGGFEIAMDVPHTIEALEDSVAFVIYKPNSKSTGKFSNLKKKLQNTKK